MSDKKLRLYRVTLQVEYEYMVAATSREDAEDADIDLDDFWDPYKLALAHEITDLEDLHEWADEEPYGDEELIAGRTCAEILEDEPYVPTDLDLEAAGQMTLLGAA